MTDRLIYNRPIFLFYIPLIILEQRPLTCKGDVFLFTVREEGIIDELSAIIGSQAQQGKGKERACPLGCDKYCFGTLAEQRKAFGPACGNIGEGQGKEVGSLH